jgi:hypothetical protein
MSPNPPSFIHHLQERGYHPRSDKHSNALAEAIVRDLLSCSAPMAERAAAGALVYDLNFTINAGTSDWNVDLVLGAPPPGTAPPEAGEPIRRTRPSTVQIAIEIKSVMTEHHKAVKNRKRDLEAHHEHVHRYSNRAIAGGVVVVNGSASFISPLRTERTAHRNPAALVERALRAAGEKHHGPLGPARRGAVGQVRPRRRHGQRAPERHELRHFPAGSPDWRSPPLRRLHPGRRQPLH